MGTRKYYSDEFKKQIVTLYHSGKKAVVLEKEYGVSTVTIYEWVRRLSKQGNFKTTTPATEEEKELRRLEKENKELRIENEILKKQP